MLEACDCTLHLLGFSLYGFYPVPQGWGGGALPDFVLSCCYGHRADVGGLLLRPTPPRVVLYTSYPAPQGWGGGAIADFACSCC